MPWRTLSVKEQRTELVTLARKPEANLSELALRFGVSRKTDYKWLNRNDMDERSRRPKRAPRRRKHVSSPCARTIPPGARARSPETFAKPGLTQHLKP